MKNIIFFAVNMHIGGMEKALADLLNRLAARNYRITLLLEKKEGELLTELDRRIAVKEYRVYSGGNPIFRKAGNLLKRRFWILKNHNKYDFSCAYATYSVIGSRLALAASKNSALYVHSNYYDVYSGDEKKIEEFFAALSIEKFGHVIFVSKESRDKLARVYGFLKKKGTVIDNLIDVSKIKSLAAEEVKIDKEDFRLFLFVGRLEEESKRLSRLIRAFASAYQKNRRIRLWIIGDGKDRDLCRNLINELQMEGIIRMLGKKENPYPYIKNADCVLLTSDYEGYPVIYSECLILQTPLITTIPVSDGFVDIREYAKVTDKSEMAVADAINNTDLRIYRENKIDFETINLKKLESLEKIINCDQEE